MNKSSDKTAATKEFETNTKTEKSTVPNYLKLLTPIIKKYGKNIPKEISAALKEILEKELTDINFDDDMMNKDSIKIVINDYMRKVSPTLKSLSGRIAEVLKTKIQSEYEAKKEVLKGK